MKKEETKKRYGEEAYNRQLWQHRVWSKTHMEERKVHDKKYRESHQEQRIAVNHEICRKNGKYYDNHLKYNRTGLQGDRNRIRRKHQKLWNPYKNIIAQDSQIHHQWRSETSEYDGVALVETNAHRHGIIKVIEILEGGITLFTERGIENNVR